MELTIKIELPETAVQAFVDFVKQMGQLKAAPGDTASEKDRPIMPNKMYNSEQTCEILDIKRTALHNLVKVEAIVSSRPGKKRLFKGQDIINYIENGKA